MQSRLLIALVIFLSLSLCATASGSEDAMAKMSWDLVRTVQAAERQRGRGEEVELITAVLLAAHAANNDNLQHLRTLGYSIVGAMGRFILVEAPADYFGDRERGLAMLEEITNASLPPLTLTNANPMTSGSSSIGVDAVWNLGYRGQDTIIAVIDDGFDLDCAELTDRSPQFHTIIPSREGIGVYSVLPGTANPSCTHGAKCALVVSELAPDAELHLLSSPPRTHPLGFLNALLYATETLHADVIVTSMELTNAYCHNDGTGPVNEIVGDILQGTSTSLVVAAGNWAGGSHSSHWHYSATYRDDDGDFHHDFTDNAEDSWDRNTLRFTADKGDRVVIFLEWDDWNVEAHREDLDLYILDGTYGVAIAESRARQYGSSSNPSERTHHKFEIPATGTYCIQIRNEAVATYGEDARPLHFNLYAVNLTNSFTEVEHTTTCGSIREVATHPAVISVGAVSPDDDQLRGYSARGGGCGGLRKPEVCAPDGVYKADDGVFIGTSASAPYVAGVLALLHSLDPSLAAADAVALLQETAVISEDNCGNKVYAIDLHAAVHSLLGK